MVSLSVDDTMMMIEFQFFIRVHIYASQKDIGNQETGKRVDTSE